MALIWRFFPSTIRRFCLLGPILWKKKFSQDLKGFDGSHLTIFFSQRDPAIFPPMHDLAIFY